MKKQSEILGRLGALRGGRSSIGNITRDPLVDFGGFGGNPGRLRARKFVPENLPEQSPLVVVLHGCTQTAVGYDHGSGWSTLAGQQKFALLYPEQEPANNANRCFNWFVLSHATRDSGEALSIRRMIEAMVVEHGLDRRRIYITGLSAGGAMTSVMLATYPEVFAGGAILSGLPYGVATTVPEAFERMRGAGNPTGQQLQRLLREATPHNGPWPSISVWHGSADRTVAPSNAEAIVAQWRGVHRVGSEPERSEILGRHRRQVWCDLDGREVIESYSIVGMGHGTPLATTGKQGLGKGGPFLLDVGISSTRRIAQFWGIAPSSVETGFIVPAVTGEEEAVPQSIDGFEISPAASAGRSSDAQPQFHRRNTPTGVRKVIEDALRSAGLMR